jgi:hypothetical protein
VGFDIATGALETFGTDADVAVAAVQQRGAATSSRLFTIDLQAGKARDRGAIGEGEAVRDIAIASPR